jgi:hypothetical protein
MSARQTDWRPRAKQTAVVFVAWTGGNKTEVDADRVESLLTLGRCAVGDGEDAGYADVGGARKDGLPVGGTTALTG